MKAALRLELFGENNREYFKLYRHIFELFDHQQTFDDLVGGVPPRSSWVAEIAGPDETYGLRREFLRPKLDYSRANAQGSRGIFAEYILESGHIYEVLSRVSWSRNERYFCTVSDAGDVVELSEADACHAVGAETKEERRARRRAEKLSGHRCSDGSETADR